jgi:hypothetical protein
MSSEIWIPPDARPKHQCNVPGCGAKFYDTDEYIRHVARCADRNRERLITLSEEHEAEEEETNPLFSGAAFDPEALEFQLRRHQRGR